MQLFVYLIDASQEGQGTCDADGVTLLPALKTHQLHAVQLSSCEVIAQCGIKHSQARLCGVLAEIKTGQVQLFVHNLQTKRKHQS